MWSCWRDGGIPNKVISSIKWSNDKISLATMFLRMWKLHYDVALTFKLFFDMRRESPFPPSLQSLLDSEVAWRQIFHTQTSQGWFFSKISIDSRRSGARRFILFHVLLYNYKRMALDRSVILELKLWLHCGNYCCNFGVKSRSVQNMFV